MTLKLEIPKIVIVNKETDLEITVKWLDEGVVGMTLSDGFYLDEETIDELTPAIKKAFNELMKE